MANSIIQNFSNFRQKIKDCFNYNKEATMNLIDAIAGTKHGDSVVKISLSRLFFRGHTSIFGSIKRLFWGKRSTGSNTQQGAQGDRSQELSEALIEYCPTPSTHHFLLIGTDCTPQPRIFANKLADRTMVHAPNKVAGAPVTIGHEYSIVACLPENSSGWVYPLSVERVLSSSTGVRTGVEQLTHLLKSKQLEKHLIVNVADSAYSTCTCIKEGQKIDNMVQVLRLRGNRVLNKVLKEVPKDHKRGRPRKYGEELRLENPTQSDETLELRRKTKRGVELRIIIDRWKNVLVRGEEQCQPFDVVRVRVVDKTGKAKYKKPLWLAIVGNRRQELNLEEIFDAYTQRFSLENFFRFSKRNLLIDKFQTADVEHEENWWWLCIIGYAMLFMVKGIAGHVRHPWERKDSLKERKEVIPSQAQRDYERIIKEIGVEAKKPKRRGKSFGQPKGWKTKRRPKQPVIRKSQKTAKVA